MKNIHLLPTDKPSRLHLGNSGLVLCDLNFGKNTINGQNIYITSDEEIKKDWCIDIEDNTVFKVKEQAYSGLLRSATDSFVEDSCKKIILTTDQDLIKDGVQAIDDEFLEWFVNNPSCEEVEVKEEDYSQKCRECGEYVKRGYNCTKGCFMKSGNFIPTDKNIKYKIIIPKEEPKQEVNYYSSNLFTEKKEAIEFADYLLGNFEMAEFEKEHPKYVVDDELCWQLAGTQQKYTTVEMYQIWLNESTKTK